MLYSSDVIGSYHAYSLGNKLFIPDNIIRPKENELMADGEISLLWVAGVAG